MIYELKDVQKEQFWMGAIFGGLIVLLITLALGRLFEESERVQLPADIIQAYNTGVKDALTTSPASAELELACAKLWGGKQ